MTVCDWCGEVMEGHNPAAFRGSLKATRHPICIVASERQQNTPVALVMAVSIEKASTAVNWFWRANRRLQPRVPAHG